MRRLAPLLLLLATCTPVSRPLDPAVAVAPSQPAPPPMLPAPPHACSRLVAEAAAGAKSLFASARQRALDEDQADLARALSESPPDLVAKCWPGARGAWFTRLESLKTVVGWGAELQLRWALDFVDETGRRSSVVPSEQTNLGADGHNFTVGGPDVFRIELVAFDFDGDGTPEIFVGFSGGYHEAEGFAIGRLYTAGRGAIELYAPAKGIAASGLRDVDGDGRPDLVTTPFAAVGERCGSAFPYRIVGPELIAHALPGGTFSQTDAIAVAAARKSCPARPRALVVAGGESNTDAALMNVACARVWGESSAALESALDRECPPPPAQGSCGERVCSEGALLREAARKEPPIVLR